jgi:hypothetical protein
MDEAGSKAREQQLTIVCKACGKKGSRRPTEFSLGPRPRTAQEEEAAALAPGSCGRTSREGVRDSAHGASAPSLRLMPKMSIAIDNLCNT